MSFRMSACTRRELVCDAGVGCVTLGGLSALSGCSRSNSADSPGSDSASTDIAQVVISLTTDSEPSAGFDPLVNWGCGSHFHEPLIQSTLVRTTKDLGIVDDLATSYVCSEDGLTWTFTIRDDVSFSDGVALTAADVAFTINGIVGGAASECDLSMVNDAVVLNETTLEIHLNRPFNALLYVLAVVGIVPEHAYGDDYGANPIGSGRYILEQWTLGEQAILIANPDYYGDEVLMDRVVVVFMEEDASLAAARAGEVDVAFTSSNLADSLPGGYDLLACASVDCRGISLPCLPAGSTRDDVGVDYPIGNNVTCDRAVRQAINYGIDRDLIVEHVLNGYGTVAYSVGYGMPWYSEEMACETNPVYAEKLLEDAGWVMGQDGIRIRDGIPCAFNLYYPSGDTVRQAMAEEFKNQMTEIGIAVTVGGLSWDEIYPHEYCDPIVWGWGSNDPTEIYNIYYSTGSANFASYVNTISDAYMDEALAQPDIHDSFELWQKAQWDGIEGPAPLGEAAWVWLANIDHLYFTREGLTVAEQKPHPHAHGWSLLNNVDQWTWN